MASEDPQFDRSPSDNEELPPAVIAQAEAAASNSSEREIFSTLDSTSHEGNLRPRGTIANQKYVKSEVHQ